MLRCSPDGKHILGSRNFERPNPKAVALHICIETLDSNPGIIDIVQRAMWY